MELVELVPDQLWHVRSPLHFGPLELCTRMTVVRLRDGGLWIHSPVEPEAELVAALRALGTPRHVVAPNRTHHLQFLPFMEAFPEAGGFVAPGLADKRPDLARYPVIPLPGPWGDELESWFIDGLPVLNETVWFHRASGTLILTDLLFCFGPGNPLLTRWAARLLGVHGRLAMSRTMKRSTRDKAALRRSVEPLLSLPVERIVLAHDQVIDDRPAEQLQQAFAWLG